jgi:CheY-like chemotaxis protein
MIVEQPSSLSTHGRLLHTGRPSVVVADDDADARELLSSALVADGYAVVEARDGYELLGLLAASVTRAPGHVRFDAIVTDVMMPGFSGLDVLTAVQRHLDGIPVVVVTAFGDARVVRIAEALGSIAVVSKPFDLDDLRTTLANAIARPKGPPSSPELDSR